VALSGSHAFSLAFRPNLSQTLKKETCSFNGLLYFRGKKIVCGMYITNVERPARMMLIISRPPSQCIILFLFTCISYKQIPSPHGSLLYRFSEPFFLLTALPDPFSAVVFTFSRTSKSSAPELLAGVSSASRSESSSSVSFFLRKRLVTVL
jgi:hypothetical protein